MLQHLRQRDARIAELESKRDNTVLELDELSQEIHRRILMERALQRSEDQFRSLTESTSASIFILRGKRCCYANAAAEATIPMKATRGRASFLGERSIGHMDPGARSSALMIAAAVAALEKI